MSAADGTNIVKVFQTAIMEAKKYKASGGDALSEVLDLLSDRKVMFFSIILSCHHVEGFLIVSNG